MLDRLRAWDIAQEDLLILHPNDTLFSAVEKLLERAQNGVRTPCGIVQDKNGRFLGTLSTHRALRAMGHELQKSGAFKAQGVDVQKAVRAVCHLVGGHTVGDHMYDKALEVKPSMPAHELLKLFSTNTAHFAVVTEAGKALGLIELDDIFKTFAGEMLDGCEND